MVWSGVCEAYRWGVATKVRKKRLIDQATL